MFLFLKLGATSLSAHPFANADVLHMSRIDGGFPAAATAPPMKLGAVRMHCAHGRFTLMSSLRLLFECRKLR